MRRSAWAKSVLAASAVLLAACGNAPAAGHKPAGVTSTSQGLASTPSGPPAHAARWTARSVPAGVGVLNDVACPSATRCYAVGGHEYGAGPGWIIGSADGRTTWTLLLTTPQTWYAAVSCPTANSCIAVGGGGGQGETTAARVVTTNDGGRQWASRPLPAEAGALIDLSCPSATICVAIGGDNGTQSQTGVERTVDGGASWTPVSAPRGMAALDTVTCQSGGSCVMGGASPGAACCSSSMSATSHDGGASWSPAVVAGGPAGLSAISCADAQHCVGMIGSAGTNTAGLGFPVTTDDGGASWARSSTTVGWAVSCTGHSCISVGAMWESSTNSYPGDAYESTDGGVNWDRMSLATTPSLSAVTCLATLECIAVGGDTQSGSPGVIVSLG